MTVEQNKTLDPESGINQEQDAEAELPSIADTVDKSIDVSDSSLGYDLPKDESKVVSNIAEKLSKSTQVAEHNNAQVVEPSDSVPFDISKLSIEQIQQLKHILEVTPNSVKKVVRKPTTKIRTLDGKYLVEAKRSFMRLRKNTIEGRDELAHYILVRFHGEANFVEKDYREVMQADRIVCEIVSTRYEDASYIEGEPVVHRETGKLTEREVKVTVPYYTIKLPNGETVELKGEMSNF